MQSNNATISSIPVSELFPCELPSDAYHETFRMIEGIGPGKTWEDVFKEHHRVLLARWTLEILKQFSYSTDEDVRSDYEGLLILAAENRKCPETILCDFFIPWNRTCDGTDARCHYWAEFISSSEGRLEEFKKILGKA